MDLKYEDLVQDPEAMLKKVCEFIGESYSPAMLDFYKSSTVAKGRGNSRYDKPLGHATSTRYIGIHKELLSLLEQRIFTTVAGKELEEAGYKPDVDGVEISDKEADLYREYDGRIRAATLTPPKDTSFTKVTMTGWSISARRRKMGVWDPGKAPKTFPIGDPNEELIMGQRAWRKWKEYLCIKRKYAGKVAL